MSAIHVVPLGDLIQHTVPNGTPICSECVGPDEDPAPWCDCQPDEQCSGPCRHRAHGTERCHLRAASTKADSGWLTIKAGDDGGDTCACLPQVEHVPNAKGSPDGWMHVHHSLDGREAHE